MKDLNDISNRLTEIVSQERYWSNNKRKYHHKPMYRGRNKPNPFQENKQEIFDMLCNYFDADMIITNFDDFASIDDF